MYDENKMNKHMSDLLKKQMDTAKSSGSDVKEIPHKSSVAASGAGMMDFTTMLEAMDEVINSMGNKGDLMNEPIEGKDYDEKEAIEELNKLFTPVLIMQSFEKDSSSKSLNEIETSDTLTERSIIQFDDETRMSQLTAIAAKLIAKMKDTESWKLFVKASRLKKEASLNIQKEEWEDAKTLAQKYLVYVSTSNPSSVARKAATELLPQTQKQ